MRSFINDQTMMTYLEKEVTDLIDLGHTVFSGLVSCFVMDPGLTRDNCLCKLFHGPNLPSIDPLIPGIHSLGIIDHDSRVELDKVQSDEPGLTRSCLTHNEDVLPDIDHDVHSIPILARHFLQVTFLSCVVNSKKG